LPAYKNFGKVPITKRDLVEFPEDVDKTKNTFTYESEYNDYVVTKDTVTNTESDNKEIVFLDIGYNMNNHTLLLEKDANTTHPAYLNNVTYTQYFKESSDKVNCDFDKCKIMGLGCEWPYTATDYIKMDEAYPWTITAQTNIIEGYNTTFCVKCYNGWDSIT